MSNQGVMKEIRIDIQSELAMNIINYLISEENYIYVGNERDIWLENLSHPTVQLIYINQRSLFSEEQVDLFYQQVEAVRSRVRRRYLMGRLNILILNLDSYSSRILDSHRTYIKVIHVNETKDFQNNTELQQFFTKLQEVDLNRKMTDLIGEMHRTTKEKALDVKKMLLFQNRPFVTYFYIALLVAVFAFLQFKPLDEWGIAVFIDYGAKYNPLILSGQYYRLLTASLLHADLLHLLFNAVMIYQFGKIIEHVFGWWRMVILIIGSALFGNLCSYAFVDNVSLGASTVAFGLLGAFLFLGLEQRKMFMHLVKSLVFPIILFSAFWAIIEPGVDGYGHLGGLIGGFLMASIVGIPNFKRYLSRTVLATATMILLVVGLFQRGNTLTEQTDYTLFNQAMTAYYYQSDQPTKLVKYLETLNIEFEELFK